MCGNLHDMCWMFGWCGVSVAFRGGTLLAEGSTGCLSYVGLARRLARAGVPLVLIAGWLVRHQSTVCGCRRLQVALPSCCHHSSFSRSRVGQSLPGMKTQPMASLLRACMVCHNESQHLPTPSRAGAARPSWSASHTPPPPAARSMSPRLPASLSTRRRPCRRLPLACHRPAPSGTPPAHAGTYRRRHLCAALQHEAAGVQR